MLFVVCAVACIKLSASAYAAALPVTQLCCPRRSTLRCAVKGSLQKLAFGQTAIFKDYDALQDWPESPQECHVSQDANAILIFMPGAPEITRLVRQLESSPLLRQAAKGQLRVLPLHGALPSQAQVRFAAKLLHRHAADSLIQSLV